MADSESTLQTFTIPFTVPNNEESSTRLRNETGPDGAPVPHRELITGFDRDGGHALMVVNGSMPYYLHGTDTPSGNPHTLVVLAFHMLARHRAKRFRSVRITVTFTAHGDRGGAEPQAKTHLAHGGSPTLFDPEVVRLAPHGTALYHRTPHTVSTSHTLDLGLDLLPNLAIATPRIGYTYARADTGAPRADAAVRVVGDRVFGPCSGPGAALRCAPAPTGPGGICSRTGPRGAGCRSIKPRT